MILAFSRMAVPLTLLQKTTGSLKMPAPKAIRAGDDEVGGGGGLEPILSKCKDEKSYEFN